MSKFQIFLSHKSKDEALARELAEILVEPCSGQLEIYLMETIPEGTEWLAWIKKSVADSHMLLLLFTDETLEWDWCLYEAGLFAGSRAMDFQKVVCIHDPKTEQPRQLAHLQSVPAEASRVKQFLENLYIHTREKWQFENDLAPKASIDKLTNRIVELLQGRASTRTERYGRQMEIEIRSPIGASPADIVVNGEALRMFGLQNKPQRWAALERCAQELGQTAWLTELGQALDTAREGVRAPRPVKSSFHFPDDESKREYRPCLYQGEWRHSGVTTFSVLFSEEPSLAVDRSVTKAISNFGELIEALLDLIDTNPEHSWIRFVALTPALGFLAKSQNEWDRLEKRIADNRNSIQMVCLAWDDLMEWHGRFKGRRTKRRNLANDQIDENLIKEANAASKRVTELIAPNRMYYELPWDGMPDIYLFSNAERAILITPFHLPRLDQDPPANPFEAPYVEMFGSVTNAPAIVKQVNDMQDYYVGEAIQYAESLAARTKTVSSGE